MKTEFIDVSDTRKNLVVEIPSTVVDAEIDKVSRDYSKAARIPGFRPGKVPAKIVRQRFRDQILHDVAHGLIPRAVDEALRERGVEPVDTPDIRDVVVEEGQPLKFTATFDTVPAIEPGDYNSIQLRRNHDRSGRFGGRAGVVAAARASGALRAGRGSRRPGWRLGGDGSDPNGCRGGHRGGRRGQAAISRTGTRTSRSTSAVRPTRRVSTRSSPGLTAGATKTFDVRYAERLHDQGAGRIDGDLRRHGQGGAQAHRAGSSTTSSPRMPETSPRSTRCVSGCGTTCSSRRRGRRIARCGRI